MPKKDISCYCKYCIIPYSTTEHIRNNFPGIRLALYNAKLYTPTLFPHCLNLYYAYVVCEYLCNLVLQLFQNCSLSVVLDHMTQCSGHVTSLEGHMTSDDARYQNSYASTATVLDSQH